MSTLSLICDAFDTKLKTSLSLPDVQWTQSLDLLASSVLYPRIEIDLVKVRSSEYISQREMKWNAYFRVMGFLKKTTIADGAPNNWTKADKVAIADFGMDSVKLIYSLLDDVQAGTVSIPNFIMFSGDPEVWFDLEILPKISVFAFTVEAVYIQADTEV
jgi:hypothetical protein